jgi:predicted nuclease of restriction endonuclease-like (RecB) superfamily
MGVKRKTTVNPSKAVEQPAAAAYGDLVGGIAAVLETARRTSVRAVNAVMTATYWEIGRRIVEYEQGGAGRAEYGKAVLDRLSQDLTAKFGRGFSRQNIQQMRQFYRLFPSGEIRQTPSGESGMAILQTPSEESASTGESATRPIARVAARFPLPWSAYVRLLAVKNERARSFYETEALRAGWSVRQLDRQIQAQFYERTALSRNKAAMLAKSVRPQPGDTISPEEEVKDPYVLEFLGLRDEYSETDLEAALIQHLEGFLLELGGDFCFVGRQRRLRIGDEWYRVDLVFYHRRLRCLVLIDLKLGRFTHADAGQMHTYLSYAVEHWTRSDILKDAYLPYRDPETLRAFLKIVDEFEYDHSERLLPGPGGFPWWCGACRVFLSRPARFPNQIPSTWCLRENEST